MSTYALIYEELTSDISFDVAEEFLLTRLKLSRETVDDFFKGKPVIKAQVPKIDTLQAFMEKAGIKVSKQRPPIAPAEATISHVYAKLLSLETQIEQLTEKADSYEQLKPSEAFNNFSQNMKDGLTKATSAASSFKDSSASKLDQFQMATADQEEFVAQPKPKGFNWIALCVGGAYYAGYGNLKKGLTMAIAAGLLPTFAIFMHIYMGFNANKVLPVKQVKFQWKFLGAALAAQTIAVMIFFAVMSTFNLGYYNPENIVKDSVYPDNPSKTIGGGLSNNPYFSEETWSTSVNAAGNTVTEFRGDVDFNKYVGRRAGTDVIQQKHIDRVHQYSISVTYIARFELSDDNDSLMRTYSALITKNPEGEDATLDSDGLITSEVYANRPLSLVIDLISVMN